MHHPRLLEKEGGIRGVCSTFFHSPSVPFSPPLLSDTEPLVAHTLYVAEDDLELLILLPPVPEC